MKFLLLFCLLSASPLTYGSEHTTVLSGDDLTLLAFQNSSEEIQQKFVLASVKNDSSSGYYKVRKNQEQLQKLLQQRHQQLKEAAKNLTNNTLFSFTKKVNGSAFNKDKSQISINKLFLGTTKIVNRKSHSQDGLPQHFKLLIANTDLQKNISIDQQKLEKTFPNKTITAQSNIPLYTETTLRILKYHNKQNFQVVINDIKLYADEKKQTLLGSRQETRDASTLINNWVLSGGISSELIGIHSFAFYGYRVQDMIVDANKIDEHCKRTKQIGPHQVIICNKPLTENSRLIVSYIGGVIAQIDLVASGSLNNNEKKQLSREIMQQLGLTKSLFEQDHSHWQKYSVDFDFYADAFFNKKSPASTYHFKYNEQNPVQSPYTTIISIISQATKKLIEDNNT